MSDGIVIANTILSRMWERHLTVRPMKLQKLLYYTVGFYYKNINIWILEESFYKWDYGPVVPEVYHHFKKYKYHIIETQEKGDLDSVYVVNEKYYDFYGVLDLVISHYGRFPDSYLSELTHKHKAWTQPDLYNVIDEKLVAETFQTLEYGE